VFSISDTAKLLRIRGQAMQQAVPVGEGAMAAILGLDLPAVLEVAAEAAQGNVCGVANDNAPGQVVVSGHKAAVERAMEIAKARGAKRALALPVSAPFHCALMRPAADAMDEALSKIELKAPSIPVVPNVLARPVHDASGIRARLVEQVTGMVRWTETVTWLATKANVTDFIELGSGKVLSGLAKRIAPDAATQSIGTPADIDAFLAAKA
jgi:[acyl-carrier-protein] S-malonyltransferase